MRLFPIIPIWLMVIIVAIMIGLIIKFNKKNILQIVMCLLLFVINLRIMIPTNKTKTIVNNLDILFVIDSTISMFADDYGDNQVRFDGVIKDCIDIMDHYAGAKYAAINFSNFTNIITPFTFDYNLTKEGIELIKPLNKYDSYGSSLNVPIDTAKTLLQNAKKKEDRIQIIIFLSDGEITDDSTLDSYKDIGDLVQGGVVLGYGTNQGGNMYIKKAYSDEMEYITTYENHQEVKAVSKIDENNLKSIAKDLKVDYKHMDANTKLDDVYKTIDKKINSNVLSTDKSSYTDIYFIFVIPLLILLTIDYCKFRRIEI